MIICYVLLEGVISLNMSSIAFIYYNEARMMQGSNIHRGYDLSNLMNASYINCENYHHEGVKQSVDDANNSIRSLLFNQIYDIYIHVKIPCPSILSTHLDSIHILDTLDKQYFEFYINTYDWHGVIFNTDLYMQRFCHKSKDVKLKNHRQEISSMECMVIPHHYNLPCKAHNIRDVRYHTDKGGTSVSISRTMKNYHMINVGIIGAKQLNNELFDAQVVRDFQSGSVNLLFEDYSANSTIAHICSFYDSINIALAWTNQDDSLIHISAQSSKHSSKSSNSKHDNTPKYSIYDFKSQERFTNPIMMNIPTIGYDKYQSFRHYNGSQDFLCPDLGCVKNLISRILLNDDIRRLFQQLRQNVMQEVRVDSVVAQYVALIRAAVSNYKPHSSSTDEQTDVSSSIGNHNQSIEF